MFSLVPNGISMDSSVNTCHFLKALIDARGDPSAVNLLPGAFNHGGVVKHSSELRSLLAEISALPPESQELLVRSLALYEQTVGGIGSPTALLHVLDAITDPEHKIFDWVVANTVSYAYYTRGATSFAEMQQINRRHLERSAANLVKEQQRAADAATRRASRASSNLFKAIRRGDVKAVEALLTHGADPQTTDADGLTAAAYADQLGMTAIAELLGRGSRGKGVRDILDPSA
jgi:hypothetical protein